MRENQQADYERRKQERKEEEQKKDNGKRGCEMEKQGILENQEERDPARPEEDQGEEAHHRGPGLSLAKRGDGKKAEEDRRGGAGEKVEYTH